MWTISRRLVQSYNSYSLFTPTLPIKSRIFKLSLRIIPLFKSVKNKKPIEEIIGQQIAGFFLNKIAFGHIRNLFIYSNNLVKVKHNNWKLFGLGASRRNWIYEEESNFIDKRLIKRLVIIYHHANSKKHIDVHIGHLSLVYRVSGKSQIENVKYNSKGYLTADSKEKLIQHIRNEIANNSRVPQNDDHTVSNALTSWKYDESRSNLKSYGQGPCREIIYDGKCEVYHPYLSSSLHIFAPILNSNQGIFIYKIYPGDKKTNPILIAGNLIPRTQKFADRLHLKLVEENQFKSITNNSTHTLKIDGGSCYLTSNGQGIKIFSPRISKITNKNIEYTYKAVSIANIQHPYTFNAMGEIVYEWNIPFIPSFMKTLSAAKIGGILNSDSIMNRLVKPKIYLYRVDKFNGKNTHNLPFKENRKLQLLLKTKDLTVVPIFPIWLSKFLKLEGIVGVKNNESINDGYKLKFFSDPVDCICTKISLAINSNNNITGTITVKDPKGKEFNLGPGSIGNYEENLNIINNNQEYIGRTAKIISRIGYTGRASVLDYWHIDK